MSRRAMPRTLPRVSTRALDIARVRLRKGPQALEKPRCAFDAGIRRWNGRMPASKAQRGFSSACGPLRSRTRAISRARVETRGSVRGIARRDIHLTLKQANDDY